MMTTVIEWLKPMYEAVETAIEDKGEKGEYARCALDELCQNIILSSGAYEGMTSGLEIARQLGQDMAFVHGDLTEKEAKERIDWHWDAAVKKGKD